MRVKIPVLALLCFALLPLAAVTAQEGLTLQASAGLDGIYKIGSWVPVHVLALNEGRDIRGELQVSVETGDPAAVLHTQPAELPSRSRKAFALYVYVESYVHHVRVRLVEGQRTLQEIEVQLQPLTADTFLCGVVSDDPTALSALAALPATGSRRIQVAHLTLQDLPPQGRVLDGLDALNLHSTDTTDLDPDQQAALRGWVAFGGHLIVCGGPNAELTAAGLGDLLPVEIAGSRTTADVGSLGDVARAPLMPGVPAVVAEVVPRAGDELRPGATVVGGTAELPLWVRQDRGRGRVDYLALDPDLEPLRTWIGIDALWMAILGSPLPSGSSLWTTDVDSSWSSLQNALSNIPGLDAPSVLLVIGFLFAYVAVVGPVNFLVLKLIDRQALAWITVSGIILLFTVAAALTGLVTRGRQVVVSQVSIVQTQPYDEMAAVDTLAGLYSPSRRAYDVRLGDHALVRRLSNPYAIRSPGAGGALKVEQGAPTLLRQVEVDVGAMRDVAVQSMAPWRAIESRLTLRRETPTDSGLPTIYRIEGTLSNMSNSAIRHNALVYGSTVIPIDDIEPGQTLSVATDVRVDSRKDAHVLLDELVEPARSRGKDQRAAQRRRSTLEAFLMPQLYGPQATQTPLRGLTLVGWPDAGPAQIEVDQIASRLEATTLLVAPLAVSTHSDGEVLLPKGFATWELIDGDTGATPNQLYAYQSPPTFRFTLSSPQAPAVTVVEKLVLHLTTYSPVMQPPPTVSLKNAGSGEWETISPLSWGQNEIPDPARYVGAMPAGGAVEISVQTHTIAGGAVSIDLEAVGASVGHDH